MSLLGLLLLLLPVAACGDSGSDTVAGGGPQTRLVVEQTSGTTSTWTLTCDPAGGDHPDPEGACRALAALDEADLEPLPGDVVCTEIYGGDQTARITGTVGSRPVDLSLSRTDGCRISQWDRFGAVLPGPVGVDPPD